MVEYGQEFSQAAICDRPSRNETCAIVEHLWLLSNTRAERRRQGPQPAARASSQGPPPRTFPHRSNSLQRRATLDHGRVRDGAQRISSGAPSEEPALGVVEPVRKQETASGPIGKLPKNGKRTAGQQ